MYRAFITNASGAALSTEDSWRRINGRESIENRRGFRPWHTHGRTGAALFVPAPPRLEGASNLLQNQINLAAGCRTLFLSCSIHLLSLRSYCPPAFTSLISLSFSLSSLGISRTRANRRHGTEMKAKKEVGRRSSVPPTRTQRREEKVAQQQRALDFWLRPSQGRSHFIPWRNVKTLYLYFEIMRTIAIWKLETKKIKKTGLGI